MKGTLVYGETARWVSARFPKAFTAPAPAKIARLLSPAVPGAPAQRPTIRRGFRQIGPRWRPGTAATPAGVPPAWTCLHPADRSSASRTRRIYGYVGECLGPVMTPNSHSTEPKCNGSLRPKPDITSGIKGRRKRVQPTIFLGDFSLP